MEKVLVTGVNGFVGGHLVDELTNQNYEVIGVGREEEVSLNLSSKVSKYYSCDLADYESVQRLPLAGARAVINLAGLAAIGPSFDNPELYMRINTTVLDTVCRAALEQAANLRVLSISSGAVYSSDQPMPLDEEALLSPESSPYAASKIAMEKLSLKYREQGLDCVVARPFNHIGPGQLPGFILPDLFKKVVEATHDKSTTIKVGNLNTKRDYTDVRDVAKAYVSLISSDSLKHGIYNVCTGRSLSGNEILSKLLECMEITSITSQADESLFRPSDVLDLFGSNERLSRDTGWNPSIEIDQAIRDFVSIQ